VGVVRRLLPMHSVLLDVFPTLVGVVRCYRFCWGYQKPVFPTLVGVVRPRFSEGGQGYFVFPTLVGVVPTLCIAVIIYSRGLPHASGGGPGLPPTEGPDRRQSSPR